MHECDVPKNLRLDIIIIIIITTTTTTTTTKLFLCLVRFELIELILYKLNLKIKKSK